MFAQRVPREHRQAEEQEHKLAAKNSRSQQQEATTRPANEKLRF
jgi:hypothetical protein